MTTPMVLTLSDSLLLTLLNRCIEKGQDLQSYICDALEKHSLEKAPAEERFPKDLVIPLYEAIAEMNHGATLREAWKHRFGEGWSDLDVGFRVKLGLRFKEFISDIASGKNLPPVPGVVLVRMGETSQDQAVYADIRACGPEFG